MPDVISALVSGEEMEQLSAEFPEGFCGALGSVAEQLFELTEGLNGDEIGIPKRRNLAPPREFCPRRRTPAERHAETLSSKLPSHPP